MHDIQQTLKHIQSGDSLSGQETEAVFTAIMNGEVTAAQLGALLMGLSIRGENGEIIAGAARAMRSASVHINAQTSNLLDTCGTGGDGTSTFNISTTVAFVVAACGQAVAKHGNRAISSKSGSADVLEALGVNLALSPLQIAACIDKIGIGFLFAPAHHPAMKHAAAPRRELGTRSIFNLLGPLTNPASACYQVVGVYGRDRVPLMAEALHRLGVRRALVVHGRDGMDEITTCAISDAILVEQGQHLQEFAINPNAFGIPISNPNDLIGGDAQINAEILRAILSGESGARSDIVLLNAAAALMVCGKVAGISEGLDMAASAIKNKLALKKLNALVDLSNLVSL
ncbi:MAG: anthranilate phosphoribosyltransferase [Mariprofundales bacterium]